MNNVKPINISKLREMLSFGCTVSEIASRFGVCRSLIYDRMHEHKLNTLAHTRKVEIDSPTPNEISSRAEKVRLARRVRYRGSQHQEVRNESYRPVYHYRETR